MPEHQGDPESLWIRGWSRQRRWARIAGSIIAGLLLTAASVSFASTWSFSPYLKIAGGYEDALLVDPGGAAVVIPGGSFLDLGPTLTLQSDLGQDGYLQLGTSALVERFFNDAERTLYRQSLWADYLHRLGAPTRLRVSLSGNYFNDTEQASLRRLQGGAELGLGYFHHRWNLEAFFGGQEVAYPRAQSVDSAGQPIDYRETRWNAGLEGSIQPSSALRLHANVVGRNTDSVLSDYDSHSVWGELGLRWIPARAWRINAFYGVQARVFDSRQAGFDQDDYQLWGVAVGYRIQRDLELRVRWLGGSYTDTQGVVEPTNRLEFAIDLGPAIFGIKTPPPLVDTLAQLPERYADADPRGIRFALSAPGAATVTVAGDFNGWNPTTHPLSAVGDGVWELWIPLEPGSYQYLYLVDGSPVVPPESRITLDDGFGGRNGLIEVVAPSP